MATVLIFLAVLLLMTWAARLPARDASLAGKSTEQLHDALEFCETSHEAAMLVAEIKRREA